MNLTGVTFIAELGLRGFDLLHLALDAFDKDTISDLGRCIGSLQRRQPLKLIQSTRWEHLMSANFEVIMHRWRLQGLPVQMMVIHWGGKRGGVTAI